jgi:hypothetical protein
MPCAGPSEEEHRAYMRARGHVAYDPSKRELAAMLCGFLSALEQYDDFQAYLNRVDWAEVGLDRGFFEAWWGEHKRQDEERRNIEEMKLRLMEQDEREELARLKAKYGE